MFILTKKNLEEYLLKLNIPISTWGKGSAKTTTHLLKEIVRGESILSLEGNKLIRDVSALSIIVTYKDLILKEDYQEFNDGRIRRRKMEASVAEKIDKDDTDLVNAVKRGIKEELEISIEESQILELENTSKFIESMSYPGIMSRVKLYRFHVDLNENQYDPNGYTEVQEDKKTFFIWTKR
jgi:hypothetical protein